MSGSGGSVTSASSQPICPCTGFVHPTPVYNPPGLTAIAYRWGDYASVRYALLQPRDGETELSEATDAGRVPVWRPGAAGEPGLQDLALQIMEWFAYLADLLTFYNERIASQAYLRTADLPESLTRLIQLLGYRPRPGIGARGTLAALVSGPKPATLPKGLQVQSKPGPGSQPLLFELDADTPVAPADQAALAIPAPAASLVSGPTASLLVAGPVGGLKPGDALLLVAKGWDGADGNFAHGTIASLAAVKAPTGATNTAITMNIDSAGGDLSAATAAGFRLLKSTATATLYQYVDPSYGWSAIGEGETDATGANTGFAELASIVRQIVPGDVILLEDPAPNPANAAQAASVTSVQELVYYANNPTNPPVPPPPPSGSTTPPIAIPIPHTRLNFRLPGNIFGDATTVVVRHGWQDVGVLIDPPASTLAGSASEAVTLAAASGAAFPVPPGTAVLVEDAIGDGAAAAVDTPTTLRLAAPVPPLAAPLRALFNLLPVSRGKSVADEVLGSGDARVAGQDFALKKAPVTYFQDPAGRSGDGYSSTVQVAVDGVQWAEAPSFYGQGPDARIFVTREDEQGNTHVTFGDGVNGATLPTGVNNVVASYRFGSGAATPAAGTLTVALQPQPALKALRNPLPPTGGADPDPPSRIRTLAPRSVLTFQRAVSLDDYAAIAAAAPGVVQAKAEYQFDAAAQRPRVVVYVAGDGGAVGAARDALAGAADPNRPALVLAATPVELFLALTCIRDAAYDDAMVRAGLHAALLDPDTGLFGINVVAIGQVFYASQIDAACLGVPGVLAVHALALRTGGELEPLIWNGLRAHLALRGLRRAVRAGFIVRRPAGPRYDPGAGRSFVLPDDGAHLALSTAVAS